MNTHIHYTKHNQKMAVRMWAYPWLTWVALAGMAAVFVLMAREPDTRVQLYYTGAMTVVLAATGYARQRARART
jgi:aromatic amino acid permease